MLRNMKKLKLLLNLDLDKVRKEIDGYKRTCETIVAFRNIIEFNLKGTCEQFRKLKTSTNNEISKNVEITPDLIVEVKSKDYSALNEIKIDLPKQKSDDGKDQWLDVARQLKKYDDDLSGWKFDSRKQHDIMITTHDLRTFDFNNYMKELAKNNTLKISRKLAILHSIRTFETHTFIVIKKDYGDISDTNLEKILSSGRGVAEYNILNELNQVRFYDANPPIPYTMAIIWDHILKTYLTEEQFRLLQTTNAVISVTVKAVDIRDKLRRYTLEPAENHIKQSWVDDALVGFTEIGFGKANGSGTFEIKFKKHTGDILEVFFGEIGAGRDAKQAKLIK